MMREDLRLSQFFRIKYLLIRDELENIYIIIED